MFNVTDSISVLHSYRRPIYKKDANGSSLWKCGAALVPCSPVVFGVAGVLIVSIGVLLVSVVGSCL